MKKIKSIIVRYLCITAAIVSILTVILVSLFQINREQQTTINSTQNIFMQVEQLLSENEKELAEAKAEYTEECLKNAETIAYILESRPDILDDLDEIRRIADYVNVDEIHLFNTDGVIFMGTHPEYYNYSVYDGEQIGFFKQMLDDKSLKIVQEITPNTAEQKYMQYSAVWSPSGKFFVQVGMNQEHVMEVTEKNELSYIFSLLRVNSSAELYAVDTKTGDILGTTAKEFEGKNILDIGISVRKASTDFDAFYENINGTFSYCIFKNVGDYYLGRIIDVNEMSGSLVTLMLLLGIGIVVTEIVLVCFSTRFLEKEVITGIKNVNAKLTEISEGNLDEHVDVRTCAEFSTLSDHINDMIKSLLSSTDKISYVLEKTGVKIGVYEYNNKMRSVRYTGKVASLLGLSEKEEQFFSQNIDSFREFISEHLFSIPYNDNVYRTYAYGKERILKYEEFSADNSMLGIIMDITDEYKNRRLLEHERDIDGLTGLLNRRGLDRRLETMFADSSRLKHGALIMIDADGLKQINDNLGHDAGDAYLRGIGDILNSFGSLNSICSRQGGDEFVLFLYGFDNDDKVIEQIRELNRAGMERTIKLDEYNTVPVRFSYGVSMLNGSRDFSALLKKADSEMYNNKRERKAKAAPNSVR